MNIELEYYKLLSDKKMGDGEIISKNQSIILINKDDDGYIFFETNEEDGVKIFFWAKEGEVVFLEKKIENWSEEKINQRKKHIKGEFF